MPSDKIMVATEPFSTDALGYPRSVAEGETFRAGHPIVKAHPGSFVEWHVDNEFEEATAAPEDKRATKPKAEEAEAAEGKPRSRRSG